MEQCLPLHVPPHTDLVLLEASANMCGKARALRQSFRDGALAAHDPCETLRLTQCPYSLRGEGSHTVPAHSHTALHDGHSSH
jgi:hypothetical protein